MKLSDYVEGPRPRAPKNARELMLHIQGWPAGEPGSLTCIRCGDVVDCYAWDDVAIAAARLGWRAAHLVVRRKVAAFLCAHQRCGPRWYGGPATAHLRALVDELAPELLGPARGRWP